jgi:hypothetical protein
MDKVEGSDLVGVEVLEDKEYEEISDDKEEVQNSPEKAILFKDSNYFPSTQTIFVTLILQVLDEFHGKVEKGSL